MRSIFDINKLNLTEYARSFALYKNLLGKVTIATKNHADKKDKKRLHSQKDADQFKGQAEMVAAGAEEAKLYTKRLLKAKQKELERKIYNEAAYMNSEGRERMEGEL
jgi:hypothetical protein